MSDSQKPANAEIAELEKLVGLTPVRRVLINDVMREVRVKKVKTGKIPKLIEAAGPLVHVLTNKNIEISIPQLMLYNSSACLDVIAVLSDLTRAEVDELDPDDTLVLLGDAVESNLDFFVRKILPRLSGGIKELVGKVEQHREKIEALAGRKTSVA
jgi:hypothetical protein